MPKIGIVALALLAACLAAAPSASALEIGGSKTVRAGKRAVIKLSAINAPACSVSGRSASARVSTSLLVTSAQMRVSFRVPRKARSARWTISAVCGAETATRSLKVRGAGGHNRALITKRTITLTTGEPAGRGAGANPFVDTVKWCTWHAYNKRPDIYDTSVGKGAPRGGWDAWTWADRAARYGGFPVGAEPVVGAVAVYSREFYGWPKNRGLAATYGHVAYVESVDDTGYTISEHTGDYRAEPNVRRMAKGQPGVKFIYGGPAGNGPATSTAPSPQVETPQPPPPREVTLTISNKTTNGATQMREDPKPAYLSTKAENFCRTNGCAVADTDRVTGQTIGPAVCQAQGARTTNGNDADAVDDGNPGLASSTRWYGVRWNGATTFINEVWIEPSQRGGMGLPNC